MIRSSELSLSIVSYRDTLNTNVHQLLLSVPAVAALGENDSCQLLLLASVPGDQL